MGWRQQAEASDRLMKLMTQDDQLLMEFSPLKLTLASKGLNSGVLPAAHQRKGAGMEMHTFKMATEEVQTEVEKLKEYHKVAEGR